MNFELIEKNFHFFLTFLTEILISIYKKLYILISISIYSELNNLEF